MDTCTTLPGTGAELLPIAVVALLLLLAGGAALLLTRRRGRRTLGALALAGIVVASLTLAAPHSASAADCGVDAPAAPVNSAPVALPDAVGILEDAAPATVTGNVLLNDSDPDGDTLTVTSGSSVLAHGLLVLAADGSFTYTLDNTDPAVDALGTGDTLTDTFTYTAVDGRGGAASATLTITINGTTDNLAPMAFADTNSVKEDASPNPVSGNVLTNDSDPDGDVLSVANAGTVTLSYGSLTITSNGSYNYTLDNSNPTVNALNDGQTLTDTFTYTVSDGHGGTASETLTVTINGTTDNSPPVAIADTNTVKEDTAPNQISGNVLTNDSDADGHTLSVANGGTFVLTYGSLQINANGTYSYTLDNTNPVVNALNDGQQLTDMFTYTVSDGHGGTASALLTVRIDGTTDNRVPVPSADTNSVKEDSAPNPISGNVVANDFDPDGHGLSVVNAGTVTLIYGVLVINADGTYTYTLDNTNPVVNALNDGEHLSDMFTYVVSDGHGGTSPSTLTVTINGTTDPVP